LAERVRTDVDEVVELTDDRSRRVVTQLSADVVNAAVNGALGALIIFAMTSHRCSLAALTCLHAMPGGGEACR